MKTSLPKSKQSRPTKTQTVPVKYPGKPTETSSILDFEASMFSERHGIFNIPANQNLISTVRGASHLPKMPDCIRAIRQVRDWERATGNAWEGGQFEAEMAAFETLGALASL